MPAKLFYGWLIMWYLAFLHWAFLVCSNYHTNDGHSLFFDETNHDENLSNKFRIKYTVLQAQTFILHSP